MFVDKIALQDLALGAERDEIDQHNMSGPTDLDFLKAPFQHILLAIHHNFLLGLGGFYVSLLLVEYVFGQLVAIIFVSNIM